MLDILEKVLLTCVAFIVFYVSLCVVSLILSVLSAMLSYSLVTIIISAVLTYLYTTKKYKHLFKK